LFVPGTLHAQQSSCGYIIRSHDGWQVPNYTRYQIEVYTEREVAVLSLRYGLDGTGQGRTLDEVGARLCLTRERIRQIEVRAFEKLQRAMRNAVIQENLASKTATEAYAEN
jgi:transcriptional regulator